MQIKIVPLGAGQVGFACMHQLLSSRYKIRVLECWYFQIG
jgi:hypothetical protein